MDAEALYVMWGHSEAAGHDKLDTAPELGARRPYMGDNERRHRDRSSRRKVRQPTLLAAMDLAPTIILLTSLSPRVKQV